MQSYAQNKGTLVPGQAISVGKYSVQVERYLSQGGFAHVYLVRTANPVYNTTHHVLKRIAVPNEAMLTEVKKEVDIMRLLKGHPNIVHLIDAAWHTLPNGVFEVFILMEFCQGGGIIDMMNRRLRERLTEAEILQIFADVCEGVAYMHNSRPALLHRDLKVENILQASPNSFKLCDFGSATTVSRTPTNMQEIRALEADLNRHTTLQYRAPEMVDPYLRRSIDEKSDVWALGVLLYKLCYYTTPFEEHGPLAILNVQYRIPPYPVYSSHMNALIASMLREHGTHRPTVFEVLTQAHQLRGTKSPFTYKIPHTPLSPRRPSSQQPAPSHPIDQPTSYRTGQQIAQAEPPTSTTSHPKNNGVQAREKVLEAIAPMRRGRPEAAENVSAGPSSGKHKDWLDDEENAWKAATSKSATGPLVPKTMDDAWSIRDPKKPLPPGKKDNSFGDDFAEKLWVEFDPKATLSPPTAVSKPSNVVGRNDSPASGSVRDAFEGLGLTYTPSEKPQTLAEARKIRTGLATVSSINVPSPRHTGQPISSTPRISPSPSPSQFPPRSPQPQPKSRLPASQPSDSSWSSHTPSSAVDGPAASRFPPLEELDPTFGNSEHDRRGQPSSPTSHALRGSLSTQTLARDGIDIKKPVTTLPPQSHPSHGAGVRSQQVTGVAMRDSRLHSHVVPESSTTSEKPFESSAGLTPRPSLTRKYRSSVSIKQTMASPPSEESASTLTASPRLPPRPPKDWLTGDETPISNAHPPLSHSPEIPRLRESPSKRASFIAPDEFHQALSAQPGVTSSPSPIPRNQPPPPVLPSSSRVARVFPTLEKGPSTKPSDATRISSPRDAGDSGSSADEGPEDAHGVVPPLRKTEKKASLPKRKGRQSSVHDLVGLWGGGSDLPKPKKETTGMSGVRKATSPISPDFPRSRPQSMLVFPTKQEVMKEPDSLEVPPLPKPRATARRTSISDMVHKYEVIGVKSRIIGATPSVSTSSHPPVDPIRKPSIEIPPTTKSHIRNGPIPMTSEPKLSPSKTMLSGLPRISPGLSSPSLGLPRTSPVHPSPASEETRAPHIQSNIRSPFPKQEPVASTMNSTDTRSTSPERPYRGVGKLIDQWQRKAADADQTSPIKRGSGQRIGVGRDQ